MRPNNWRKERTSTAAASDSDGQLKELIINLNLWGIPCDPKYFICGMLDDASGKVKDEFSSYPLETEVSCAVDVCVGGAKHTIKGC